jgi:predicted RecB family nuclease
MTFLLGAYAARSCPVKTHNAFDRTIAARTWQPDDSLAELFEGGLQFELEVLDRLATEFTGALVDLRGWSDRSVADRTSACVAAMQSGAEVIVGGLLPVDVAGHRSGQPDALVRGADQPDGTPGYHPVEVKWHKVIERRPLSKGARPTSSLKYTTLTDPRPTALRQLEGFGFRVASREADLIQLAHYHRLLQAVGFAGRNHAAGFAGTNCALAAVIGTDAVLGQHVLAWVDLDEPLVRTFSRSGPGGWRLRSLLERYDHEHAFRVDVAAVARQQTGHPDWDPTPLVRPIVTAECGRCQWWEHCRPQLDPDDVSLRIDKGPLDVREIAALRRHRVHTITDLAGVDLSRLLPSYLPEVTHRSGAESRLKVAARRARMLLSGELFERESAGDIDVPRAEIEVDFDIETSADGRIYLWGFLVNDVSGSEPASYRHFSRFDDLAAGTEMELAHTALAWLRGLVSSSRTVRVYHYSGYEVTAIRALADRQPDPLLCWAAAYAEEQFIDLLEIVQRNFFGVAGLGLKVVAHRAAGFSWRDDDPGGLNSQRWFAEAVHGETAEIRSSARSRVLEYNEDDVIATSRVRQWLRAG